MGKKKDLDIPTGILNQTFTATEAKTPLSMFSMLVGEDMIVQLNFETNRFRDQNNQTRVKRLKKCINFSAWSYICLLCPCHSDGCTGHGYCVNPTLHAKQTAMQTLQGPAVAQPAEL